MALKFDVRKYKDDGQILIDGSDSLANKNQQVISFQNIRNKKDVYFKAFITAYNETFTPNFNATEVFGRVDPIQQYKNTTRNITLAWKLPAASESEAYENLGRVQELLNMLYPSYLSLDNALTLSEAPLVRLKVMNLLTSHPGNNFEKDAKQFKQNQSTSTLFFSYGTEDDSALGMLGVITSCTINHNLEGADGVFEKVLENQDGSGVGALPNTILPKLIDVNISFTPLHEYTPGADNPIGPYGVKLGRTDVQKRTIEQGRTLSELREIKKTAEQLRRASSAIQQNKDKKIARALRAQKKFMSSEAGSAREDRLAARSVRLDEKAGINQYYHDTVQNLENSAVEAEENYEEFLR